MFIATFIIGLREGLEAALIVGIIAAFLKKNNYSLKPAVLGVLGAVFISLAVGVGLDLTASALNQAQQELMETVIGLIAVIFVTTMILWMNKNSSSIASELQKDAYKAIQKGSAGALAVMAFLAVLKEGFETAVFILAAFNASSASKIYGISGALIGIVLAVLIGYGIYKGGITLNLKLFFKITSVFLIFIAAGLVFQIFRTAHEAGIINIAQTQIADLSGVFPANSVTGAIFTGLFGIETDPRLIEILAWAFYLIPVLIICFCGKYISKNKNLLYSISCALIVVALCMAIFIPKISVYKSSASGSLFIDEVNQIYIDSYLKDGNLYLSYALNDGIISNAVLKKTDEISSNEINISYWEYKGDIQELGNYPEIISLSELTELNGSKIPGGLNKERQTGPFNAKYTTQTIITARSVGAQIIYLKLNIKTNAYLSGGGIEGEKVVSINPDNMSFETLYESDLKTDFVNKLLLARDMKLYYIYIPCILLIAGILVFIYAFNQNKRISPKK